MERLYDAALDAGVPPPRFWEMTIAQTLDVLEAERRRAQAAARRERERLRWAACLLRWHAALCGFAFHDPKRMPTAQESFPSLFGEGEAPAWKRQQAGFAAWAAAYNEKRKGGGA